MQDFTHQTKGTLQHRTAVDRVTVHGKVVINRSLIQLLNWVKCIFAQLEYSKLKKHQQTTKVTSQSLGTQQMCTVHTELSLTLNYSLLSPQSQLQSYRLHIHPCLIRAWPVYNHPTLIRSWTPERLQCRPVQCYNGPADSAVTTAHWPL